MGSDCLRGKGLGKGMFCARSASRRSRDWRVKRNHAGEIIKMFTGIEISQRKRLIRHHDPDT